MKHSIKLLIGNNSKIGIASLVTYLLVACIASGDKVGSAVGGAAGATGGTVAVGGAGSGAGGAGGAAGTVAVGGNAGSQAGSGGLAGSDAGLGGSVASGGSGGSVAAQPLCELGQTQSCKYSGAYASTFDGERACVPGTPWNSWGVCDLGSVGGIPNYMVCAYYALPNNLCSTGFAIGCQGSVLPPEKGCVSLSNSSNTLSGSSNWCCPHSCMAYPVHDPSYCKSGNCGCDATLPELYGCISDSTVPVGCGSSWYGDSYRCCPKGTNIY